MVECVDRCLVRDKAKISRSVHFRGKGLQGKQLLPNGQVVNQVTFTNFSYHCFLLNSLF